MEEILLNIGAKETRCAHLRHGSLYDLIVERRKARPLTGNIYRGRVTNILHNIQSAFIDINEGENGFIHITDIIENTRKFEKNYDMDFDLDYDISQVDMRKGPEVNIEQIMKMDQPVLVQVIKEPIGSKGARLTSSISIPGRYLVLLPNWPHRGVSRKIEGRTVRDRLKRFIRSFEMPQNMGLICRTASKYATAEMLIEEATALLETWNQIMTRFDETNSPTCLYEESDLIRRSVMTAVDGKLDRLLVDHYPTYQRCKNIADRYAKEHSLRVEYYRDKVPVFDRFGVEREIERALKRKIWLPSGGYLFFDRTEAMFTIDVNSGRYSDQNSQSNLEENLVRINLEAAEEIARQLRLRNIGGLVICDFIDMRSRKNQRRVLDRLKDCMKEDSAKCIILSMSDFGLVEMTRQRNRESLEQTIYTSCPYCLGSGLIKSHDTVVAEIERALKKVTACQQQYGLRLVLHPELSGFVRREDERFLKEIAEKLNAQLVFDSDDTLHMNEFHFYSTINGQRIEV